MKIVMGVMCYENNIRKVCDYRKIILLKNVITLLEVF